MPVLPATPLSASAEKRRIGLARLLDRWLGKPLVACAAVVRSARRRPFFAANAPVRRILFVKLWGMGSVILSEPALRWLKQRHPSAEIHYLTLARNRAVLDLIPVASTVYTVNFENLGKLVWEGAALFRRLRREPYDLVFDAEFFTNFPGLLARLAAKPGQGRVVGFTGPSNCKEGIQDISLPLRDTSHMSNEFLRLVMAGERASEPAWRPKITLPVQPVDRSLTEPVSGRHFLPFLRPYVALNVNASLLAVERRWPANRFVELARRLLHSYDFDLVLIGAASERRYVDAVERALGDPSRVWNFCGGLDIAGLAFLLSRSRLMISNDSGPIHLAAALDVPLIGFYGPETPLRYGPLGDPGLVFYENLWCSPCMHADNAKTVRCINALSCMTSIDADGAARKIEAFIDAHSLLPSRLVDLDGGERAPDEAVG